MEALYKEIVMTDPEWRVRDYRHPIRAKQWVFIAVTHEKRISHVSTVENIHH
jgi:hypothetical protein